MTACHHQPRRCATDNALTKNSPIRYFRAKKRLERETPHFYRKSRIMNPHWSRFLPVLEPTSGSTVAFSEWIDHVQSPEILMKPSNTGIYDGLVQF